jgi:PAS domain S-box-containing protein
MPAQRETMLPLNREIARRLALVIGRAVLCFTIIGSVIFPWFIDPGNINRPIVCLFLAAFAAMCLWLVRKNLVDLAAKIQALSLFGAISLGGFINGGIEAPVIASSITLVSFCTLVFGLRGGLACATACFVLFAVLLACVEPKTPPGALRAITTAFITLANALLLWETTRILKGSAEDARKEAARRAQTESALRESEERFRRLADNAPDVIFRYRFESLPARCDYINGAIERILGYRPEEFYADSDLPRKVIHPDDQALFRPMFEAGQMPSSASAIRWIARDGAIILTEQRFVPVHDADGRLIAIEGIARDVTAARAESERLRALEKQLYHAQKVDGIGTLAGGIAHDFNNILTGILGYNELAAISLPPTSAAQAYLEEVRKASLRARDLVSQILSFSRRNESRRVSINLSEAVGDALRFMRSTTPTTIKFETQLKPGYVFADPTQIHQVVLNLCTNAVQAMADRPGTLSVSVETVTIDRAQANTTKPRLVPGQHLCLTVRDTGPGMDEATARRIFEAYFTTKEVGEGTGLGLAVVLGVVTAHHGGISLKTAPEAGATFSVFLPIQTDRPPTQPPFPSAPRRGGRETILVVDDEEAVGTFSALRLRQLGYVVVVFSDPHLALAELRAKPGQIDAIITDLTMPGLTGLELLWEMQSFAPEIPGVLITGNVNAAPASQITELQRIAIVEKPFSGDELSIALRKVLDTHRPTLRA